MSVNRHAWLWPRVSSGEQLCLALSLVMSHTTIFRYMTEYDTFWPLFTFFCTTLSASSVQVNKNTIAESSGHSHVMTYIFFNFNIATLSTRRLSSNLRTSSDLLIQQEDMQICSSSALRKHSSTDWEAQLRNSVLDSKVFPLSAQHWTQNSHHEVGDQLTFPCCYSQR